jgi:hypothetical protein
MSDEKNAGPAPEEGEAGTSMGQCTDDLTYQKPTEQLAAVAACLFEPGDIVEVRRFRFAGGRLAAIRDGSTWHEAAELPSLAAALAADNAEGVSWHAGVNPRHRRGGTKAADVALARCLVADFDGGATVDDALRRIAEAGLPTPTLTIASGHGAHVYWRLSRPIARLETWSGWQRDLIAALGTDPNVHDPPRVMRLPGGMNWKPPAAECHVVARDATRVYDLATLGNAILAALPEPAAPAPDASPRPAQPTQSPNLDAIGRATLHAAKWEAVAEGGRNGAAFRRAAELVNDFALCDADALPILERWNAGNSPPLPDPELRNCLKSARKHGKHEHGAKLADDRSGRSSSTPAKPKPATKPRPQALPWRPFPTDLLPEPMRRFVLETAEAMSCDAAYVATPALIVGLASIGAARTVSPKPGWSEPCIAWGLVVSPSGTLKSPAADAALRPLRDLQREAFREHDQRSRAYDAEALDYDRDLVEFKRGKRVDPPERPIPPEAHRLIASDATTESLVPILKANPRGVLLARDEAAGWLGGFDQYRAKGGSDSAFWLEAWRGGACCVDRKHGGNVYLPRAAVSVFGTIQPGIIARLLDGEHRESGLEARLLLVAPPKRRKVWTDGSASLAAREGWANLIRSLAGLPMITTADGAEPTELALSREAVRAWASWYDANAGRIFEAEHDAAAARRAKCEAYALRIALFLELAADPAAVHVGPDAIRRGTALAGWLADESDRVATLAAENPEETERRKLVELIAAKGGGITPRELQRASRQYATAGDAEAALLRLVREGVAELEHVHTAGRDVTRFRLVQPEGADTSPPNTTPRADTSRTDSAEIAASVSVGASGDEESEVFG